MQKSQFSLLTTKRFLPLFITQFLGAFNDNVFKNALLILVTYQTINHTHFNLETLLAIIGVFFVLPYVFFSATAGQLADKFERSRLVFFTKLLEVIIMILASVAFYHENVFFLTTLLFFTGVQATFFGPLKYAILPDQLAENELVGGNALIEGGTFLAILLGMVTGGSIILTAHGFALEATIIISVSVLGLLASWFIPKSKIAAPDIKINPNFIAETINIVKYSRKFWDISLTIMAISWFWLIGTVYLTQFPAYAKVVLHSNQYVVTLFLTVFSLGIGIGSLLCNRLLKGKVSATYVPLGALGITVFTLDLYFTSRHPVLAPPGTLLGILGFISYLKNGHIIFDVLLIAISGGVYTVPLYAILQHRSPPDYRARMVAVNNIMNSLFMVLGGGAIVLLAAIHFSITGIFLIVGLINLIVAIYICKLLPDALLKSFVKWLLSLLFRVEVSGLENFEQAGDRVIIIANHTSFLDAGLLAAFLPDKLTFAVNTFTAKKWWIRLFLTMVDAYPLDPTNPMAIKSLIEYVGTDKKCVIFPEGRITVTGTLMKVYEGPGMIADKSGAKLLPVRIDGAQLTHFSRLRGKVKLHWFPKIKLTIAPPQSFNVSNDLMGRKRRQVIGRKLYDIMADMIFNSSQYQETLFSSLLNIKSIYGSHHIIAEDIERKPLSYQKLILRSFILGDFIAKTTHRGENVGVLLPNSLANMVMFFALHAYNRVPALLNFSTGTHHVVMACNTAQIKQVYTARRFVAIAKLTDMVEKISQAGVSVIYLEDLANKITLWQKLTGYVKAQFPQWSYQIINKLRADDILLNSHKPAVILFTSGSEGAPKGVVLSHANIQANRYQLSACIDFTPVDIAFNALPLFHSFGLTGGMLLPVLSGIKVFLYPSPLHYRIIPELSYDTNATIIFGTDTFLAGYAKYAHPYDFYSLRYVFAGAEKLRDETRQIWSQKFGVRIFEGYGATETSPILSANTPMYHKQGTVGRLMPAIHYLLQPVEGVTDGARLIVSGPNIMLGYLRANNPGVLEPPAEGWYDTGDIVSIDDADFITIKGRAKRFAKIGGEMVSLTEVESYINELWSDAMHAIINIPDRKKGEQLVLVTTYAEAARDKIIAHFKQRGVSEINIPKKIIVVKTLPVLGSGKTDYMKLKEMVLAQEEGLI